VLPLKRLNSKPKVIGSPEFEAKLLSAELAREWQGLSLKRRALIINYKYGISVSWSRLRLFYKRNGFSYRVQSATWRISPQEMPQLLEERTQFA
jgi:transposase